MAKRTADNGLYYINPSSLTFVEDSGYGANFIQVSASSSCYILVYSTDYGITAAEDNGIRKWKVTAYNNKFPDGDTGAWNIYVKLEMHGVSGLIVYDKRNRLLNGAIVTQDEDGNEVIGEADGSYYYVKIGTVGETNGTSIRQIEYDTGYLDTYKANIEIANQFKDMFVPHYDDPQDPSKLTWIEAKSNLGVVGGITMYVDNGKLDLPNIYAGLPIDNQTIYWEDILDDEGSKIGQRLVARVVGEGGEVVATMLGDLTNVGSWANGVANEDRLLVQKKGSFSWVEMKVSELMGGGADFSNVVASGDGNAFTAFVLSEDKKTLTFVKGEMFAKRSELSAYAKTSDLGDYAKVSYLDYYLPIEGGTITGDLRLKGSGYYGNALNFGDGEYVYLKEATDDELTIYADKGLVLKTGSRYTATLNGSEILTDSYSKVVDWNAAFGWGDHAAVGYFLASNFTKSNIKSKLGISDWALASSKPTYTTSEVSEGDNLYFTAQRAVDALSSTLSKYVTLSGSQTITGSKNFTGGLKVNGSEIVYDKTNGYWKLTGDLLVTGGITMYAGGSYTPSTITDAVNIDNVTIIRQNGKLMINPELTLGGGEVGSVMWGNIDGKPSWITESKPTYAYSEISGTPVLHAVATSGKYSDLTGKPDLSGYATKATTLSGYGITDAKISNGVITLGSNTITPLTETLANQKYVSALSTSGNSLTWTKGGTTQTITVPYASKAKELSDWKVIKIAKNADAPTVYKLIANLSNWKKGYDSQWGMIGVMYGHRGGNMSGTCVQNIVAYCASWSSGGGGTGYEIKSDVISYVRPVIVTYNGVNYLALKMAGSGSAREHVFMGYTENLLSEFIEVLESDASVALLYDTETTVMNGVQVKQATNDGNGNDITKTYLKLAGGTMEGDITSLNIKPKTADTYSLGNSSLLWSNVYAKKATIDGIEIKKSTTDVLYIDANLVVRGGITMYGTDGTTTTSIWDNAPIASTSQKGIASFDSNFFSVSNGKVTFIGDTGGGIESITKQMVIDALGYTPYNDSNPNGYITSSGSITGNAASATKLESARKIWGRSFDGTADVSGALSGVTSITMSGSINNAVTIISEDDASTIKGSGHKMYFGGSGYANQSYYFRPLYGSSGATTTALYLQNASAASIPTFTTTHALRSDGSASHTGNLSVGGSVTVNGGVLTYDSTKKYWKMDGDLLVTGGVTMFGNDSAFSPSTITKAVNVDGTTIINDGTKLMLNPNIELGGGATAWDDIVGKPNSLKNPYSLSWSGYSSGSYDGSSAKSITIPSNTNQLTNGAGFITKNIVADASAGLTINYSARLPYIEFRKDGVTGGFMGGATAGHMFIQTGTANDDEYSVLKVNRNGSLVVSYKGTDYAVATEKNASSFTVGNATTASKLSTTSKTIWGQTYWTSGGVPTSISGDMSNVGAITPNAHNGRSIGAYDTSFLKVHSNYITSGASGNNLWLVGGSSGAYGIIFALNATGGNTGQKMAMGSDRLYPYTDGGMSLGSTYYTWDALYLKTGNNAYTDADIYFNYNGVTQARIGSNTSGNLALYAKTSVVIRGGATGSSSPTTGMTVDSSGNILTTGGITMYSDERKKTILNHVELTLKQVADAPIIEHYYNSDEKKTTHVGSIAQYWAGLNDWFCKEDGEGYLTMEIQNAALASAISVARELVRYESKTDKQIRLLKKRICELEDEIETLKCK